MALDPFADDTVAEAQDTVVPSNDTPAPSAPVALAPVEGGHKVRITLKGGAGFDAPWITIDGTDVRDALEQITGDNAEVAAELIKQVAKVGAYFAATGNANGKASGGNGGGGQQRQAGKPAGASQAPNGDKRYCEHGEMEFRSGVSKAGNAYKGFFCPSRDRNNQCKAQFLR